MNFYEESSLFVLTNILTSHLMEQFLYLEQRNDLELRTVVVNVYNRT